MQHKWYVGVVPKFKLLHHAIFAVYYHHCWVYQAHMIVAETWNLFILEQINEFKK
jgi:hypothetical protein